MSIAAELPDAWRAKAGDYLRTAKAYHCNSVSEVRGGLVKGAAVLKMCADELEMALAEADQSAASHSLD